MKWKVKVRKQIAKDYIVGDVDCDYRSRQIATHTRNLRKCYHINGPYFCGESKCPIKVQ